MIKFYATQDQEGSDFEFRFDEWTVVAGVVLAIENWFSCYPAGKIIINSGVLNHKTVLILKELK